MLLPFDAHNHVHMGPPSALEQLMAVTSAATLGNNNMVTIDDSTTPTTATATATTGTTNSAASTSTLTPRLSGMAIMSTHPRDFSRVLELASLSSSSTTTTTTFSSFSSSSSLLTIPNIIIPCIGIHPWFLHELTSDDWELVECSNHNTILFGNDNPGETTTTTSTSTSSAISTTRLRPQWVQTMQSILEEYPTIPVGEIGLDKFHFDPRTGDLTTPMEVQIQAMEYQLELACLYQRPISVHCVRAMGSIFEIFDKCQKSLIPSLMLSDAGAGAGGDGGGSDIETTTKSKSTTKTKAKTKKSIPSLPPRIYFHAFGGKVGSATQLYKKLEKNKTTKVYFGFAPVINFESPKTIQVIQEVGLDRLVLETDHEDASYVIPNMELALNVLSQALNVTIEELIERTNQNVCDLYGITKQQQQ